MTTLQTLQAELGPWQQHNFPGRESWIPLLGMVEEVGELSHAYIKRHRGIRGTPEEHKAAIEDAIADIVIYLCDFCNSEGIDVDSQVSATWNEVKKRDWKTYPKNGLTQ